MVTHEAAPQLVGELPSTVTGRSKLRDNGCVCVNIDEQSMACKPLPEELGQKL